MAALTLGTIAGAALAGAAAGTSINAFRRARRQQPQLPAPPASTMPQMPKPNDEETRTLLTAARRKAGNVPARGGTMLTGPRGAESPGGNRKTLLGY